MPELRPLDEYHVAPYHAHLEGARTAHLLVLREKLRTNEVSHRDPDGQLVLGKGYELGPVAGWALHLPYEKNPLPGNTASGKSHWSHNMRAVRTVRETAFTLALHTIPPQRRIRVRLDWFPNVRRTRDEDNVVRCMKTLVDGLRSAMVIPDDDRTYCVREMPQITYRPKTAANPRGHMLLRIAPEPV